MLKVAKYNSEGFKSEEDYEPYEVELSPNDIKAIDEGIDKNIVSLELAPRHAPRAEVKLTNGDDNSNTNNLTIEQISVAIANGLPN